MGEKTAIEWTGSTWNPWRGCDKVSPGCAHCYMFTEQRRYGRDPSVVVRCSDSTFYAPVRARKWLDLPPGHLVFTCSWSDWFHEDADEWRDEAWAIIRQRPDLTFQVLTKRPERIADHLPDDWGDGYPNVWLGVTIENRRFVGRADLLRSVPAEVRFISAEPLLGPLVPETSQRRRAPGDPEAYVQDHDHGAHRDGPCPGCERRERNVRMGAGLDLAGIQWVICGGESGARARRFDLGWARDLRDACARSGTAFFLKQLGGHPDKRGGDQAVLDGRRHIELPVSRRGAEATTEGTLA